MPSVLSYAVFRKQRAALLGAYVHDLNLGMLLFGVSSLVIIFLIDMHILHLLKLPVLHVTIRSILFVLITLAMLKGLRIGLVQFFRLRLFQGLFFYLTDK